MVCFDRRMSKYSLTSIWSQRKILPAKDLMYADGLMTKIARIREKSFFAHRQGDNRCMTGQVG